MYFNHIIRYFFKKTTFRNYLNCSQKKCILSILSNIIFYWQGAEICKMKQSVVPKERYRLSIPDSINFNTLCTLLNSNSQPTAAWQ